jgi:hypothetical protein
MGGLPCKSSAVSGAFKQVKASIMRSSAVHGGSNIVAGRQSTVIERR